MGTTFEMAIFENIILIGILACYFLSFLQANEKAKFITSCARVTNVPRAEEYLNLEPLVQTSATEY